MEQKYPKKGFQFKSFIRDQIEDEFRISSSFLVGKKSWFLCVFKCWWENIKIFIHLISPLSKPAYRRFFFCWVGRKKQFSSILQLKRKYKVFFEETICNEIKFSSDTKWTFWNIFKWNQTKNDCDWAW